MCQQSQKYFPKSIIINNNINTKCPNKVYKPFPNLFNKINRPFTKKTFNILYTLNT